MNLLFQSRIFFWNASVYKNQKLIKNLSKIPQIKIVLRMYNFKVIEYLALNELPRIYIYYIPRYK